MPIFEFVCKTCGLPFEELLRNTEAITAVTCPDCASPDVGRKMSTIAARVTGKSTFSFNSGAPASCNTGST